MNSPTYIPLGDALDVLKNQIDTTPDVIALIDRLASLLAVNPNITIKEMRREICVHVVAIINGIHDKARDECIGASKSSRKLRVNGHWKAQPPRPNRVKFQISDEIDFPPMDDDQTDNLASVNHWIEALKRSAALGMQSQPPQKSGTPQLDVIWGEPSTQLHSGRIPLKDESGNTIGYAVKSS
jgi:hypothetical protein